MAKYLKDITLRKIRHLLIRVAKNEGLVTYSEVNEFCDLGLDFENNPNDKRVIGGYLGDISRFEHENGRPLLSILAVHKTGDKMPNKSFFDFAKNELGAQPKNTDDISFWATEPRKCHERWKKQRLSPHIPTLFRFRKWKKEKRFTYIR